MEFNRSIVSNFEGSFDFLSKSLSSNSLNNFTVANASPLALCLCVRGIPNCLVSLPKLYEFTSKINFLDNSKVHKVFLLKL